MATEVQCVYCFETLAAKLEKRPALSLQEVEALWSEYRKESAGYSGSNTNLSSEQVSAAEDEDETVHKHNLRPRQISRLQSASPAIVSSSASTSSNSSSQTLSSDTSKASSKSSLFSLLTPTATQSEEEHPLFVTWNTISSKGHKSLRGCIGTFEAQKLSRGLKEYALTSALHDHRFSPIDLSELPSLACDITLLLNFTPCKDPLDWELGTHGIRISFVHHNRRYGSTYLPQVAPEQGWTKEETVVSLMRKAGWSGRSSEWRKVSDFKCIRYEGKKADLDYSTFEDWRRWVDDKMKHNS